MYMDVEGGGAGAEAAAARSPQPMMGQYPPGTSPAPPPLPPKHNNTAVGSGGSSTQVYNIVNLVLRVLTTIFLLIGLILLSVTKLKVVTDNGSDSETIHFSDFTAYRYAMSALVIGFVYGLVQIGLSVVRLIMPAFGGKIILFVDFYSDKVVSYLLGTGAAAGFGLGVDAKRNFGSDDGLNGFFEKANAACALLFIAFVFTAASSTFSSTALRTCK